jgi:hypothetical protein
LARAVAAILAISAAPAGAASLKADYGISLAGIPIGSATLTADLTGDRYKMEIQARMTGLVGAITGGAGGATATGSVGGARPLPGSYAMTSRSSSDQRTVRLGLNSGNVASVDISPPIEERADRVPVKDPHKRGILDPVSALLMPVMGHGDPLDPGVCNRTLPVFDGAARFDVVLSYAETRNVETAGYNGPVIVCNARYVAIAGHRADRPATKFMEENRDLSAWLAPVEGTRLLLPLRISVRTMIGTSVIEATRWTPEGDPAKPTKASARARTRTE